jgi:hypothetical protein
MNYPDDSLVENKGSQVQGLSDILKAADRRIGRRRLEQLKGKAHDIAANKVIDARIGV